MPRSEATRDGYIIVETLVVLGLTLLVGAAFCTTLIAQSRIARSISDRVAYNDAARASLRIVQGELRLAATPDIRSVATDSVAARWVRASGIECKVQGTNAWFRVSGIRDIDTSKDSVVVVTPAGERVVPSADLTRDAAACVSAVDETVYRVTVPNGLSSDGVILIFESGSYYLSQRALRYRIGGEGRQPLTEEYLRDGLSAFTFSPADSTVPSRFTMTLVMKTAAQQTSGASARFTTFLPNSASN